MCNSPEGFIIPESGGGGLGGNIEVGHCCESSVWISENYGQENFNGRIKCSYVAIK